MDLIFKIKNKHHKSFNLTFLLVTSGPHPSTSQQNSSRHSLFLLSHFSSTILSKSNHSNIFDKVINTFNCQVPTAIGSNHLSEILTTYHRKAWGVFYISFTLFYFSTEHSSLFMIYHLFTVYLFPVECWLYKNRTSVYIIHYACQTIST